MNTLHGFGCSYMHGLQKEPKEYVGSEGPNKNKSVGAFIAEELGAQNFNNLAQSGCSNVDIANQVKSVKYKKHDFVFILWTGLHRAPLAAKKTWIPATAKGQERVYKKAALRNIASMIETYNFLSINKTNFVMSTAFQDYKFYQYDIPDYLKSNWIDGYIKNNSMLDIITDKWGSTQWENFQAVVANDIGMDLPDSFPQNDIRNSPYVAGCFHPSQAGHEKAGKYYAKKIKEMFWQKMTT